MSFISVLRTFRNESDRQRRLSSSSVLETRYLESPLTKTSRPNLSRTFKARLIVSSASMSYTRPLYICITEQNILALRMELSRCSKHSKSFSAALGAIPRDDFSASRSPVIVYVLPLPVCPYAMTVTLIPFNKEFTIEEKKDSKSSFCVVFGENTFANVDLCSSAKRE